MDTPPADTTGLTFAQALANAARLLNNAEAETNLMLMERVEKLADSWVNIAALILQRDLRE